MNSPSPCNRTARPGRARVAAGLLPLRYAAAAAPAVLDQVWSARLRRYGRWTAWALPGYAVLAGLTTQGVSGLGAPAHFLDLVALTSLAGLVAGTRAARWALVGMLAGLAGAVTPPDAGAAGATFGWALLGVAVVRSGVLSRTDGWLLVIAAPALFLGARALPILPLVGALLLLAAGIGVAATAGRLAPAQ